MPKQVAVDFNADTNKFLIRCPFWANDLIRNLPAVRWSKADKVWQAPLTRKNAEQIEIHLLPHADITDAAKSAMERAKTVIQPATEQFPFWYGFKTEPEKYQFECCQKLFPLPIGAIFADIGTGKSKMAIDLAAARRMEGKISTLVVICKLTLRNNWVEQLELHCPIPFDAHLPLTDNKKAFDKWRATPHDFKVLIVGTESLSAGGMGKMLESYLLSNTKVMMVVDESHMIASHDANRSEEIVRLGRQTAYRLAMTGTPLRDSPLNVFMQFEYLDSAIIGIGDYYAFRNRYAVMGGYAPKEGKMKGKPVQIVGYQNLDELVQTISPYVYQVPRSVLNLPPQQVQQRVIPMTKEQRELYNEIKKTEAYEVDGEEQVMQTVLETCLRLHQVCGGFKVKSREFEKTVKGEKRIQKVYDPLPVMPWDKNPKIIELGEILQEASDHPAVIWCAYKPEVESVVQLLTSMGRTRIAQYHGDVSEDERDDFDKGFKSGKYQYMVANQQTGSMGLTWLRGTLMVFFSNTNKMIDRVQSEGRALRRGQQNEVIIIDLLMEKSIDLTIAHSNKQKLDLAQFIRDRIQTATGREKIYDGVV